MIMQVRNLEQSGLGASSLLHVLLAKVFGAEESTSKLVSLCPEFCSETFKYIKKSKGLYSKHCTHHLGRIINILPSLLYLLLSISSPLQDGSSLPDLASGAPWNLFLPCSSDFSQLTDLRLVTLLTWLTSRPGKCHT